MGEYKQLNMKSQTYYFFDGMIDIKHFQSNLLKIDKKPYKNIDIYCIGYIKMKKFNDCEHIHSANPLYLIIILPQDILKKKRVKNTYLFL